MSDWAGLLPELLDLIFDHIDSLDVLSFRKVCSTWRSVYHNFPKPKRPLPWLMLAENKDNNDKGIREFYSLTEKKIYSLVLPELREKICKETKGWLLTLSKKGEISLMHPLTCKQIALPHVTTFENYEEGMMDDNRFVHRAVLSLSPNSSEQYVIMVICGDISNLAYWRPGEKTWNFIDYHNGAFQAIEYYRGKFYAVNTTGEVWECDVLKQSNDSNPPMTMIGKVPYKVMLNCNQIYMVGSAGHLLMVTRYRKGNDEMSCAFKVYKFDLGKRQLKKLKSLGTRAIFLGHSATSCINTNRYPEINPNSVYFTEDDWINYHSRKAGGGGKDMAIFCLKDKSLSLHYGDKSLSTICPPIWTFLTCRG